MASLQAPSSYFNYVALNPPHTSSRTLKTSSLFPLHVTTITHKILPLKAITNYNSVHGLQRVRPSATLDKKGQTVQEEELNNEVEESVKVLNNAAKTRQVAAEEVLSALSVIENAKVDTSKFLDTLGGSESPGRTWMLIFTAEQLKGGRYFSLNAVQRFDAAGKRIENGVYIGPIGFLTFGRFSLKNRIQAFIFERIRIKIGPLNPFDISLGQKEERESSTKGDPFFIWFYIDEEIAVARGRSGGTVFWCRCRRVAI